MDRIEAWLFLGRLLNLQSRMDEAEAIYREAVERDPLSVDAQSELAQLVWMRTADLAKARAELDLASPTPALTQITVRLLQDAGDHAGAYALAAERAARDPSLHVLAARAALRVDPAASDRHLALAPMWANPLARAKGRIEADLALGRGAEAARRAEALHATHPDDHYATALLASAWRLAGDARAADLYDYSRLVKTYLIEPPPGWGSLEAYLADLEGALDRLHGSRTHPLGQSLRHGSQTQRSLLDHPGPGIRGFFEAIDAPVRAHMAALGEGGGYAVTGAWSVRLNRRGYHTDHVHPEGWLSSAFYLRLPKGRGGEGWIKFGEPGIPTSPGLDAGSTGCGRNRGCWCFSPLICGMARRRSRPTRPPDLCFRRGARMKLVIWDVDGTLVDSRHSIFAAASAAYAKHGLPLPTYDEVRQIVGMSLVEGIAAISPQMSRERVEAIAQGYREAFGVQVAVPGYVEPLYDGAAETLGRLRAEGWKIAMATGKSRRGVETIIRMHGWADLFDSTHCADDGPGKPHPAMVLEAMKALGAAPEQTIVVGDTAHDMRMAKAAGVHARGCPGASTTAQEVLEGGADDVAGDFAALNQRLDAFAARLGAARLGQG
ncbi:MAG: HAD-IA family hydrolase [Caulobacteraceae bacterium]